MVSVEGRASHGKGLVTVDVTNITLKIGVLALTLTKTKDKFIVYQMSLVCVYVGM